MGLRATVGWLLTMAVVVVLTLLTQIGGLIWLLSLCISRLWRGRIGVTAFLLLFASLYAAGTALSHAVAPVFGRVPLPCFDDGSSRLRMQTALYCVLNRQYVVPKLREAAFALSRHMDEAFPGTTSLALDANFPFFDGFPLLPHLSHADGRKLDVAFYYQDAEGRFLDRATRSPVGYFAFEQPREDSALPCKGRNDLLTFRWGCPASALAALGARRKANPGGSSVALR
ncbi:hypothetical protein [Sinorhizobium glycinis]|uniref:hypothetical protein n=1 Tax=Sinorhizobium glycinis TaxID=1472378 RepID=UPI001FCCF56D|nr:hypothetical protein [Sinorhizobium glycinis]